MQRGNGETSVMDAAVAALRERASVLVHAISSGAVSLQVGAGSDWDVFGRSRRFLNLGARGLEPKCWRTQMFEVIKSVGQSWWEVVSRSLAWHLPCCARHVPHKQQVHFASACVYC